MSHDEVVAFLQQGHTMSVATLEPDGWPHLVAMWYVLRDDAVHFWTYAKSRKAVNLRRDSRLTCLVEDGESYSELRGVAITGRGELITDTEQVAAIGLAIMQRYAPPGTEPGTLRAGVLAQAPKRVAVRVSADRIASWDHRKL